jgi:hypothetical protein
MATGITRKSEGAVPPPDECQRICAVPEELTRKQYFGAAATTTRLTFTSTARA